MRLEHLLMKHFDLSRKQMKKLISSGEVLIDSTSLNSNHLNLRINIITYMSCGS